MADTTEKTIADELRAAAAKLRKLEMSTTPGRWVSGDLEEQADYGKQIAVSSDDGALVAEINLRAGDAAWRYMCTEAEADAAWIALASPALAEPLASWLEDFARWAKDSIFVYDEEEEVPVHESDYCDGVIGKGCQCFARALAVARVLNGATS